MIKYLLSALLICAVSFAFGGTITPGNIIVLRVGDGTTILSSAAAPVFLDEYTPAGALVQSIALPTAMSGSDHALTLSGSASSEGALSLSVNGQYLTLAGYDASPGQLTVASDTGINRTIALIGANGVPNTSTGFISGSAYKKNNIRGAVSNDGTSFWCSGTGSGTTGGVWYLPVGSFTDSAIQISTSVTNTRVIGIQGGQLYASSGSGSFHGVNVVGTGLPVTSGQTISNLPGMPGADTSSSAYGFYFFDENPNIPGFDVLYICDDHTNAPQGGLYKYSLVGGTWVSNGNIADAGGLRGMTGFKGCAGVQLYLSDESGVYSLQDTGGYNEQITGSLTAIASAGTNTIFHGVAFAPGSDFTTGLQVSASDTGVSCYGAANGSISLTVSGGANYTYTWSDGGAQNQSRNNLSSGTYKVTVTSAGCSDSLTTGISQPDSLSLMLSVTNVTASGSSDGSISLTVSGGTSGYTYDWSNGESGAVDSNLMAASYCVTVTDSHSCIDSACAIVGWPSGINNVVAAKLLVSPNPASSTVTFDATTFAVAPSAITITDVAGRIVSVCAMPVSKKLNLDVADYTPGMYFCHMGLSGGSDPAGKFIVVH